MNNANLINQSSGETEYYTPQEWIQASTECLGRIELDPASSDVANEVVKADRFFTKATDGLSQSWKADTVWMNHPFHRGEKACPSNKEKCKKKTCVKRGHHIDKDIPSNMDWIEKLISEYESGNIKEAICITFASTSEAWFRKLLKYPQCMPNKRVQYRNPDGSVCNNVTKGSCITYLGPNLDSFIQSFQSLGTIKVAVGGVDHGC
ncbi:TPA: hypothetical protein NGS13_004356 [Vibrio parahaemolyticus]|nr:hypothetical protein [Vibrio parahaemolyticus]HCE1720358.1 hypothetical protein [Vibrio parahaemolyticus]HCE1730979.1 hypothetical protein [Vibrio parahaemolyticus]HCE2091415.1 hypothetical protein [Vibrio parahaemolyticus]HCE2714300.1 hypothetical protein [Vibrio parahaemolyticus]